MRYAENLEKPIFFVGMGRSGTTLIFEIFSRHRDLGWPSYFCHLWPRHLPINIICGLLNNKYYSYRGREDQYDDLLSIKRILPRPDEAYPFWDNYANSKFSASYLYGEHASLEEKRRTRGAVKQLLFWQLKKRFCAKITGPGRITYLQSIFPDARFIHLIRDGRAVVDSLLRVDFWKNRGLYKPFWDRKLPSNLENIWKRSLKDPAVLAAAQWVDVLQTIRSEAQRLPIASKYTEFRYEDFVNNPGAILSQLYDFVDVPIYDGLFERAFSTNIIKEINFNPAQRFTKRTLDTITNVMRPLLNEYGYDR